MKELSTEEKAKLYDEAKLRMSAAYNSNRCTMGFMNEIFPELKESEDERIRKELIEHVKDQQSSFISAPDCRDKYEEEENNKYNSWIAWLEKQAEQKPYIIQWKGNNLKEVIDFTGKDKNFEKWFKSFEEYEKYVDEHNGIFKLFNADGSHYEIPVGAWIVKTPDGYNVASKAIFKQKPTDKVEPKFHEGDWVVHDMSDGRKVIRQIVNMTNKSYILDGEDFNVFYFNDLENDYHLWTIQDAKDGDVLAINWHEGDNSWEKIIIFKKYYNKGVEGLINAPCVEGYGNTFKNGKLVWNEKVPYYSKTWTANLHPATKEQRELLFQKMREAGYEWDAEKKELREIEQKPAWSEEDDAKLKSILFHIEDVENKDVIDWLKSLKYRVQPKQEWTEKDEKMFISLKTLLNNASCYSCTEGVDKILAWIKQKIGG